MEALRKEKPVHDDVLRKEKLWQLKNEQLLGSSHIVSIDRQVCKRLFGTSL